MYFQFIYIFSFFQIGITQLLINVRNQGGEILQETLTSNVTSDTVMLEYLNSDGTLITQLIDFKREVQVLKVFVLGEEERGQSQYQVMCFITHIPNDDFISSDAISKLRQKNPGTIRTAEENRGIMNKTMGILLYAFKVELLSKYAAALCSEAMDTTYTSYKDLEKWSKIYDMPISNLMTMVKIYRKPQEEVACSKLSNLWFSCLCRLELHIPWYPCSLKFCKSSDRTVDNYRCGIKTCKKGYRFSYFIKYKQLCLWDE